MIALGGAVNLIQGGVIGAILFSVGLLTILSLRMELFTGKAGLYVSNKITLTKLYEIWLGNFVGAGFVALTLLQTPKNIILLNKASEILAVRASNGFFVNLIYGIFCGILMFAAVKSWAINEGKPLYAIFPVAVFILCGFNHCVADMFYLTLSGFDITKSLTLIPTTIGNFIGCNIISWSFNKNILT